MQRALAVLIVCSLAGASLAAVNPNDDKDIVGAKIRTCNGCRLNHMPQVRAFLNNEARQYPALHIEYIPGHNPELEFLNKYERRVEMFELASMDGRQIQELLQIKNIHTWTPAPQFVAPEIAPTANCIAWRQTGNCDGDGPREPKADESCLSAVSNGRSGYCECSATSRIAFGCEHTEVVCETACLEERSAPTQQEDGASTGAADESEDHSDEF